MQSPLCQSVCRAIFDWTRLRIDTQPRLLYSHAMPYKRFLLILLLVFALPALACSVFQNLGRQPAGGDPSPAPLSSESPTPLLPSPTPLPTATPLPSPTPTPPPQARIQTGDQARANGDWPRAEQEYDQALQASTEPELRSAALLGLGRTRLEAGSPVAAEATLLVLLEQTGTEVEQAYGNFYLAEALVAQGRYVEAADAYLQYLVRRPGLVEAYVLERRAAALFAAGDYAGAIADYRAALDAPAFLDPELLLVRIGRSHAAAGDYGTALGIYQQVFDQSSSDFTRAQMVFLMGQAYTTLGQMDQAYAAYQQAVNDYPTAYDSYQALLVLVNAGIPVNELNRGIVDYYAGEYGVALAALDRYLHTAGSEGAADPGAALYYYGLSQRALGNYAEALQNWDQVIQNYPDHRFWDDAWEQKGYTEWFYMRLYEQAIQTLAGFAAAAPAHPRAAEFIFDAGLVAERDGRLEQAAAFWQQQADQYPGDTRTPRALFLAGLAHYQRGDFAASLQSLQRYLANVADPGQRAAGFFWQGKAQLALGDAGSAAATWEIAAAVDPTGYYSERARDLLRQRPPFEPPAGFDIGVDWDTERRQAEEWLRSTFTLGTEVDLASPGALAQEPRFKRGAELWELGLTEEARREFESLRLDLQSDAAASYRLGNHLLELGLYRSAILAHRQILSLAGMSDADTMNAPLYFNHIRFGTYYYDLIQAAAQEFGFHPLLLLSVVRQESAFEGFVRSSAGARGLMQIVPATGQEIAQKLEWPENYTDADLYRPQVSVRMGASYLAEWRDRLDGDLYAALAAYNGGPGNAMQWQAAANGDQDLFLEVVRFEETRNYIRGIYELYSIYRRLYERAP